MGVCLSCLGLDGEATDSNAHNSESTHLLSDSSTLQYGSAGSDPRNTTLLNQEEVQRQRDNLEALCAKTNSAFIDVATPVWEQEPDIPKFLRNSGHLVDQVFYVNDQPSTAEQKGRWSIGGAIKPKPFGRPKQPVDKKGKSMEVLHYFENLLKGGLAGDTLVGSPVQDFKHTGD